MMSNESPKGARGGEEEESTTMASNDYNCSSRERHERSVLSASQQSAASNNSTNNNPIRHRGRALVRGKFRRVWRPRHLEVLSNGLVRYYEVPEPAGNNSMDVFVESGVLSSSNSNSNTCNLNDYQEDDTGIHYPHSKIPKNTLAIHHARIIDVTTLRDMHVGLPRGSFGFLFHGHPIDDEDMAGGGSGEEDIFHLMGQCQGNTNLATPRDFLCAVNSLEEAQSWVIALQWAASMGRDASFHFSERSLPYTLPSTAAGASHEESSWTDHHEDGVSVSSSSLVSPQRQSETTSPIARSQEPSPATVASPTTTTTTTLSSTKKASTTKQSAAAAAGKMIVTKVVGYTLVRVESWKWEIAYQVCVLLVMPTQQQHQQVQEWSILRTGQDIQNCIEKMSGSLSKTTSQKVHQQTKRIAILPNMQSSPQQRHPMLTKDLDDSLSVVDSVLRSFCMEAAVVNSPSMKRFLGLHHHSSVNELQQGSPFWDIHNSYFVLSRPKHTVTQGIDQFVKKWLQQPRQKRGSANHRMFQLLCWYLRLPQPSTTYAGAFLLSLWLSSSMLPSINRFIEKYQILPYVNIRLDALLLSWCAAAGLGNFMGSNRCLPKSANSSVHGKNCRVSTKNREVIPMSSPGGTSKKSTNGSTDSKDVTRPTFTRNRSLMDEDEDDSQDVGVDDGEEEEAGAPEDDDEDDDDEDGSPAVEASTSFMLQTQDSRLSSPLPEYSADDNVTESCWSIPKDNIFNVRGRSYLTDKVKVPSGNSSFTCEGVDMWMADNPERDIARHPSVLGGRLANADKDMFLVNFLLPFGNFVSYFSIPPLEEFANPQLADVWTRFIEGDQQYRDARLKLLPVVVDGPWIVRAAVPGTSPALLGKAIPLQYFFTQKPDGRSVYEIDVIITASSIAKGILSVVKGHAKALSIAFAFIIEAAEEHELPETVLASFQINSLHLEDCPLLPDMQ